MAAAEVILPHIPARRIPGSRPRRMTIPALERGHMRPRLPIRTVTCDD
jgi:hypothetical protein